MTYSKSFKFGLATPVRIDISGETGTIMGRSDHLDGTDQYCVRYCDGNGCAQEKWFAESALVKNA